MVRGLRGREGGGWNFPQKAFRLPVRTAQWGPAGERGKVRDRQRENHRERERKTERDRPAMVKAAQCAFTHTHTPRCSAYVYIPVWLGLPRRRPVRRESGAVPPRVGPKCGTGHPLPRRRVRQ